jgi:hypothetical protein
MSRVVSYDGHTEINNGTDYSATFNVRAGLPLMQPVMLERTGVGQALAGANFAQFIFSPLEITIENEYNFSVLKRQLHQWFDGKDRTTKELVIENDDGSLARYQMVYPMGMAQKGGAGGKQFVVSLVADGA